MGAVLHTLNLRLHPEEIAYIVNHAEDRFLIVDASLLEVFERFRPHVRLERIIVVDHGCGQTAGGESYESFLANAVDEPEYPEVAEDDAAAMCYTSGTTGKPKGVVYSHRALSLHSLGLALPDQLHFSCHDSVLYAMSMFHANGWGFPYTATMTGGKQVLPGRNLQPEALLDLLEGGDPRQGAPPRHVLPERHEVVLVVPAHFIVESEHGIEVLLPVVGGTHDAEDQRRAMGARFAVQVADVGDELVREVGRRRLRPHDELRPERFRGQIVIEPERGLAVGD